VRQLSTSALFFPFDAVAGSVPSALFFPFDAVAGLVPSALFFPLDPVAGSVLGVAAAVTPVGKVVVSSLFTTASYSRLKLDALRIEISVSVRKSDVPP
jgi:hypothetical protein